MVSPTPRGNEGWTGGGQLPLLLSKITKFPEICVFPLVSSSWLIHHTSQVRSHHITQFSQNICLCTFAKYAFFSKYTYFPPRAQTNLQHFIIISQSNSTRMNLLEPHFHIPNHPSSFPPSPLNHVLLVPKQRDLIVLPIVPKYL